MPERRSLFVSPTGSPFVARCDCIDERSQTARATACRATAQVVADRGRPARTTVLPE